MDHLQRLITLCVLVFATSVASAQTTHYKYYAYLNPVESQPRFSTPLAACQAYGGIRVDLAYGITYNCYDQPTYGFLFQVEGAGVTLNCTGAQEPAFTGSGAAATWTCVNPADTYCAASAGSPVKQAWISTSMSLTQGKSVCATGGFYNCSATVNTDYCGQGADGKIICEGSGVAGSTSCTPSPDPTAPSAPGAPGTEFPNPPPPGTCPGTVNGVAVNVPCSSTASTTAKTTQTNDGAGNVTTKSDSKATTCTAAGSCTTTITTTTTINGGTPVVSSSSTTQGKGEYCASNPGTKECGDGEGSSFGGTCQASFTCEGDAVQCATAKAVNDQLCKLKEVFEMDSETLALSTAVMNGTHVDHPKDDPRVENVGSFDQTNPFGSACPGDVSFNIASVTMAIPLSQFCAQLQLMGNLLVAFTLLSATMFVIRGVS